MIDFIYVIFLTSNANFSSENLKIVMLSFEYKKENSNNSETEYQIAEFSDFFIDQKNKKIITRGLGEKSASLNAFFSDYLKTFHIPTAYIKKVDKKKLQYQLVTNYPFRIKLINAADTRTAKIFSIKAGTPLELPIQEFHFGDLKESIITESHIISFDLCSYEELKLMGRLCSKVNAVLKSFFERRNASLVEVSCIFGKFEEKIYLAGDFSPMSLKVISKNSKDKLPQPYKVETSAQMNKYADYLLKLTNGD